MSIFNSLGSNYSSRFVIKNLFAVGANSSRSKLQRVLNEYYKGSTTLTYKGREALELALIKSNLPKGSSVGINGFTCYVVYEAVVDAGYKPIFIDVHVGSMHFGLDEIKKVHSYDKNLSCLVVQNTLGYPADMVEIENYCRENKLMVIEDLAHSLGAVYEDGREAGTVGLFAMFSFSQDKPLDVVAGGAVVNRLSKDLNQKLDSTSLWKRKVNRMYPFWTALIRGLYPIGLGRVLHLILKKLHLLTSPLGDAGPGIHKMSSSTAKVLLSRWTNKDNELNHRREIAEIYQANLPKELLLSGQVKGRPTYLRFPIVTTNRQSLINFLKNSSIYIGDTWYDAPIGPKKYLKKTDYEYGQCPEAEKLAETILNLPTHIHITPQIANNICAKIKQWQTSK